MIHAQDEAVTRLGQRRQPQPTLRSRGLLVCALLLGLLAMHGLGPVPGAAAGSSGHDRMTSRAHTAVTASMPGGCDHGDGGCTGHANLAAPTCASASVPGTPGVAPVLLSDPASCAELQLLRIWSGPRVAACSNASVVPPSPSPPARTLSCWPPVATAADGHDMGSMNSGSSLSATASASRIRDRPHLRSESRTSP
ncbi:DUF6153 family protein [Streptomyces sp. NPDC047081]|uniref:DUF6153 family protein n=1 Tax=Streptomyces sp. NPDC047081 TaxID=3154706 RepID=UPI00340606AF